MTTRPSLRWGSLLNLDFNVVLACNVTCAFGLMTGTARTQRVLFEKHGRGVVVVARL